MSDQHEQAGEAEDGEDRALPVRPQPARGDENSSREDPGPSRDAHDPVVGGHRHAVGPARLTVEPGQVPVVDRAERRAGRPGPGSAARPALEEQRPEDGDEATVDDPNRDQAEHEAGVGHAAPLVRAFIPGH